MSKELIANQKQVVAGIVKAYNNMEHSKKNYVLSVISFGEKLIEAKEKIGHGGWETFCKNDLKSLLGGGISSPQQALKYMQITQNKLLVLEYFNEEKSVNQLTKAIADATPEQLAKAEQLKIEEEFKRHQAETEKQRKALEARKAQEKDDGVIEGDFKEVKQEAKKPTIEIPEENPIDLLHETIDELHISNGELIKEIDSITKILDSNDQVAKALAEAKKYREENRVLKERINGLQNEANEAKRTAKYWKGRFEKLEKELVND